MSNRERFILGIILVVIFTMILKVVDAAYGLNILKTPGLGLHSAIIFFPSYFLGLFMFPVIEEMVKNYQKK
ncbi:MAG: hypothetical protein WC845_04165 [Candidatus Staskawiczbacteria bacterium]|jgi:hypothetical protein